MAAAVREVREETAVVLAEPLPTELFDIDVHTIPASSRGPRHEHFDMRFLVEMDDDLEIPGNDESHQVLWVPLHRVPRFNNNRSTLRMVEKTRRLRCELLVRR